MELTDQRVAIVHDWLVAMRGAERCLEALLDLFPRADVYALFHKPGSVSEKIEVRIQGTSFLQQIPSIFDIYPYLLPIMPCAVERFDLSGYDLIISSNWCCAKGVIPSSDTLHVCYCYTPMRFGWDLQEMYFGADAHGVGFFKALARIGLHLQRIWDVSSSMRVDRWIAVSKYVAKRMKKAYGVDAAVVYPPVNVEKFRVRRDDEREEYFLMVTSFEPNKRVDVAVEAFNQLGLPLKIVGEAGRLGRELRQSAKDNVKFLGRVSEEELRELYARAVALVQPGVEDFGIAAVEALASGTPVVGCREGGLGEVGNETVGVLVDTMTSVTLSDAVQKFLSRSENKSWDRKRMTEYARKYSKDHFLKGMERIIQASS